MCETVIFQDVMDDGQTVVIQHNTIRELINMCPKLAIDHRYHSLNLDACLCPLDLPRTAQLNNYQYKETDNGMGYIFEKIEGV